MSGGLVTAVVPGGLAARAGLQPGDELVFINGHALRDVIDVQFYSADERLTLEARRDGETLVIELERLYGESLGLEFAESTFDPIRRCNNDCEFCFVAQMPPIAEQPAPLRSSLYVKDDDYRLSFLTGSYVTLTNLKEADWSRIGEQKLSPLYVSVHATDPDLRRRVLRNPGAPDVLDQLERLAALGIEVHTQIVVVPGLNDGPHIEHSIGDLAALYPAVRSVSIVPLGLSRFHRGDCRIHTDAEMRLILKQVGALQVQLRELLGVGFAYLSDEWYLRLGEQVPEAEAYDGLDLAENGVGLVRRFLDDWRVETRDWLASISSLQSVTIVTGTLFAPVMGSLSDVDVVPVVNHFFGETVTVAGLLTGQDVIAQLKERELGEVVVLPAAMFGGPEGQALDGAWPQEIEDALGRVVMVAKEQ
jgi:putative radical SAM enzyme (TIGR03279 family)